MSTLSFARIMYGTNENPETTRWMRDGLIRSRLAYANAPLENWLRKILHAVLPRHF